MEFHGAGETDVGCFCAIIFEQQLGWRVVNRFLV